MADEATPLGGRNPVVVEASQLHRPKERRERNQTLIEGPHVLFEAVDAGATVRTAFATPGDAETFSLGEKHGFEVHPVGQVALKRLSDTVTPRGPVAVVDIPEIPMVEGSNVLVAYGISEPGNLGGLIRVAAAFGWGFAYTPGSADPWAPKTLRGSAGTHFRVAVTRIKHLSDLTGWNTVSTVVSGGVDPSKVDEGPYAVLVGEESPGLPDAVVISSDVRVTIPMPGGTESLNAAVAAGIVVYELSR